MDEKKRILEMIKDGKLTVDEGMELLEALSLPEKQESSAEADKAETAKPKNGIRKNRKLRIDVDAGESSENARVRVAIPMNLVKALLPVMKAGIIPEDAKKQMVENGISVENVMAAIEEIANNLEDLDEDIVNIATADSNSNDKAVVKIYVD